MVHLCFLYSIKKNINIFYVASIHISYYSSDAHLVVGRGETVFNGIFHKNNFGNAFRCVKIRDV